MMKSKIMLICLLVLFASACDKNKSPEQQATPATSAIEHEAVPSVTSPESEQAVTEVARPAEPQQAVVATVSQPLSGEAIYKKTCMGCHASGAANAPKVGDKTAWKPRIAKGMKVLLQSAINGVPGTAMMKRGTCTSCSDDDLKAAIEYMVAQSK